MAETKTSKVMASESVEQVVEKYGKHLQAIADFVYGFRIADNDDGTPDESDSAKNSRFWLGIAAGQILDMQDNEEVIAAFDAIYLAGQQNGQQAERERCAKKADALGCKCMCGSEIAAAIRKGE